MTQHTTDKQIVRPVADIIELADGYRIMAELPGVTEDAVEVTLERQTLTIRAEVPDHQPADLRSTHREFSPVIYERTFTLSRAINREQLAATMRHGVLTVDLPKVAEQQPRQIKVAVA